MSEHTSGYQYTDFEVGEDLYLALTDQPRRPDRSSLMPVRVVKIERDVTEWAFPTWLSGDKIWVTRSPYVEDAATYVYIVGSTSGPLWRFEEARSAVFQARLREDLPESGCVPDGVYEWLGRFTVPEIYQASVGLGLDLESAWQEYLNSHPVQWIDPVPLGLSVPQPAPTTPI